MARKACVPTDPRQRGRAALLAVRVASARPQRPHCRPATHRCGTWPRGPSTALAAQGVASRSRTPGNRQPPQLHTFMVCLAPDGAIMAAKVKLPETFRRPREFGDELRPIRPELGHFAPSSARFAAASSVSDQIRPTVAPQDGLSVMSTVDLPESATFEQLFGNMVFSQSPPSWTGGNPTHSSTLGLSGAMRVTGEYGRSLVCMRRPASRDLRTGGRTKCRSGWRGPAAQIQHMGENRCRRWSRDLRIFESSSQRLEPTASAPGARGTDGRFK